MVRHALQALLTLFMATCGIAWAQAPEAAPTPLPAGVSIVTAAEGISEYALPNGLHILLLPDASKPTTTVNMTVKVGSRNENYGETGMAHLLEHMMFKGTTHHPSSIQSELSQRGLRFNGSTSFDRTNYFASMAESDSNLEWYLQWLSDSLVNSTVLRRDLDSEMTVVRNEMESGENSPDNVLFQEMFGVAFHWHNYGKATIGARSDVENVDIAHLQAFYHTYYQPDNTVLIISGKFAVAQTLAVIAKSFGAIAKPARVLQPTYTLDPAQDGERSVTVRRVGDTPLVFSAYHVPAGSDPQFAAAILSASILGGNNFRLNHTIVEKGLAAEAGGFAMSLKEPGLAVFEADLKSDQPVDAALAGLLATVEYVPATPFTEDELARAKNIWQRGFDNTFNDPERVGIALSEFIALGDWRLMFLRRDRVKATTLAEVNAFAKSYYVRSNRTVGTFIPTASPVRAPAPQFVDVPSLLKDFKGEAATSAGEEFDTSTQNINARTEIGQLTNGMRYALLPKHTRGDKVIVNVMFHFGDEKSLLGQDFPGAAVPSLLPRGTTDLTREEIATRFEKLQTSWNVSGGAEGVTLSVQTTRANLMDSLRLGADVMRKPRFDSSEFEQMRSSWVASTEESRSDPGSLLSVQIDRYGNPYPKGDVRYAGTVEETLASIRQLKLGDSRNFYRDFYGATNAVIVAVGDFDPAALKTELEREYGDWKSPKPWARVPRPFIEVAATEFKVEVKDKQNATLIGEISAPLREGDREFQALRLGTRIFGAGPASRLWERIRQREGLSYSVGTALSGGIFNANATWEIEAIFAPQNATKVRTAFDEELARALRDGFTEDELAKAKAAIALELRLGRAQDGGLAGLLGFLVERNQTPLYLAEVQKMRDSITLEETNAAFRKYVQTGHLVIGVAGDFQGPQAK